MKRHNKLWLPVVISIFFWLAPANACTVSTTGLNFTNYDVFSPLAYNTTGTVSVLCTIAPPPDVTISIGPSTHSGGFIPRQMKHASLPDLLSYNLYIDAGGTSVWGDGTSGTQTVFLKKVKKSKKKPKPVVTTIYGIVPPLQNVSIGTYSDLLTVTIVW